MGASVRSRPVAAFGQLEEVVAAAVNDPSQRFARVVRLAQRIFDVPMASVNLLDGATLRTVSPVGLDPMEIPRSDSICAHTVLGSDPLVVEDASADERFHALPAVCGPPDVRFYAGYPLRGSGGHPVGTLCIMDRRPRSLDAQDVALLADLGSWVEKELAIEEELSQAATLQRQLLPARAPDLPGFEVAGSCRPAREVGGDFYDWHAVDDDLQVVLGDVMGKGIAAALIASSVRALMRGASMFNPLDLAVTRVATSMAQDLEETTKFVTLFAARLDPATARVSFVDAGHGLGFVLDGRGGCRRLLGDGLPLGAIPGETWTAASTTLEPGETLVAISDGFLDFHPTPQVALAELIEADLAAPDAACLVEAMTALTHPGQDDDVTVVVVRRSGR